MPEENKKPTYRMLGESGLWADEEGNMYSPSELGFSKPVDPAFQQKISNRFNDFGVLADLNDKTNPSYWHFYYDPRYCGPDPEAWMEKMAARAKAELEEAQKESTDERCARLDAAKTKAAIEKADRDMEEVFLRKIKPEYTITACRMFFQGIMDHRNVLIASSQRYSEAGNYYNGLAIVQDSNKRLGFINTSGEVVIPCKWVRANQFVNGLAKVSATRCIFSRNIKWVYINRNGDVVREA
ncbi:MAG: WG repeat-containing protein [Bacteroidales bacterium]|nr:WG repeat-containing protein [Bacteroidales bacterium]